MITFETEQAWTLAVEELSTLQERLSTLVDLQEQARSQPLSMQMALEADQGAAQGRVLDAYFSTQPSATKQRLAVEGFAERIKDTMVKLWRKLKEFLARTIEFFKRAMMSKERRANYDREVRERNEKIAALMKAKEIAGHGVDELAEYLKAKGETPHSLTQALRLSGPEAALVQPNSPQDHEFSDAAEHVLPQVAQWMEGLRELLRKKSGAFAMMDMGGLWDTGEFKHKDHSVGVVEDMTAHLELPKSARHGDLRKLMDVLSKLRNLSFDARATYRPVSFDALLQFVEKHADLRDRIRKHTTVTVAGMSLLKVELETLSENFERKSNYREQDDYSDAFREGMRKLRSATTQLATNMTAASTFARIMDSYDSSLHRVEHAVMEAQRAALRVLEAEKLTAEPKLQEQLQKK